MTFEEFVVNTLPENMFFRFADEILSVTDDHIVANCTYQKDAAFYEGHFPENPVTPGSILLETAVQCGPVGLMKYKLYKKGLDLNAHNIYLLGSKIRFKKIVLPGEKVTVETHVVSYLKKIGMMRSRVKMTNEMGETVLHGSLTTQIIQSDSDEKP